MELIALVLLPFLAGALAPLLAGRAPGAERWVTIAALALAAGAVVLVALTPEEGRWLRLLRVEWMPALGVGLILALDGLSAALVLVTAGLGIVATVISWDTITERSGVFHLCLAWTCAAAIGVFIAFDLLVYFFFWEAMLIPSFLLISLFGHGERERAGMTYLIFNAAAGFGLLAGVLALAASVDPISFDAFLLAGERPSSTAQHWMLAGFLLALLVKLPALPVHAWLAEAHTRAPTAGSILLAGVLLKTGSYGLFRFPPMLFPDAVATFAPFGMALGAAGAVYGGVLACGQSDAKRLVAYTSVAHMGLVLLGISAGTTLSLAGAGVEMVAHAISGSALFLLVGVMEHRYGTRDLTALGGAQASMPRFAAAFALFFAAALAMPGTANFVGEALIVLGVFTVNWVYAVIAVSALVISVVYATRLIGGIVFGEPPEAQGTLSAARAGRVEDLRPHELWPLIALAVCTILFGVMPHLIVEAIDTAVTAALATRAP
ncbi:MAG: NuoM family protein [Paracoccaceae bacterium]